MTAEPLQFWVPYSPLVVLVRGADNNDLWDILGPGQILDLIE